MSKYVYIRELNRVFNVSEDVYKSVLVETDCLIKSYATETTVSCYCIDGQYYSNYIEFDNFEDLIEVGDLVGFSTDTTDLSYGVITKIYNVKHNFKTINFIYSRRHIMEIWKRVNNTFVRVCHKLDVEWVID